jgi:hypothetical protein
LIAEQAVDGTHVDGSEAQNVVPRAPMRRLNFRELMQKFFGNKTAS